MSSEDALLCIRARSSGSQIVYEPMNVKKTSCLLAFGTGIYRWEEFTITSPEQRHKCHFFFYFYRNLTPPSF